MEEITSPFAQEVEEVRRACTEAVGSFYRRLAPSPRLGGVIRDVGGEPVDAISARVQYHSYPYLFLAAFPRRLDPERVRTVAVATQLYAEHVIVLDKLMDRQIEPSSTAFHAALLSSHFRLRRALALFASLFRSTSAFWSHLDDFAREHAGAVFKEKTMFHGSLRAYRDEEMELIAKGKQAPAKIVPVALAMLSRAEERIEPLTRSQDLFAIGLQLYDDLIDWRVDYGTGRYSYLLAKAVADASSRPDPGTVGKTIHFDGLAASVLTQADGYFERALECVEGLGCDGWVAYVRKARNDSRRLKADLEQIAGWVVEKESVVATRGRPLAALRPRVDPATVGDAIDRSLRFLLGEQRRDYPEARHLELVGKGDRLPSFCQWGSVFQRALLTDALLDARDQALAVGPEIIGAEIRKLVAARLTRVRGGWSYFPGIPTLPPDADDLGQMLQVLAKAGYEKIVEVCEEPVSLLVGANRRLDGALDTWIADPDDPASLEAKRNMMAIWGSEPDVEVVANALYGLWAYDRRRYADLLDRGAAYLETRQAADGHWSSSWYWGRYYGTWACVRLLKAVRPGSPALAKSATFLRATRSNGGWGEPRSTALDTALALSTLCTLGDLPDETAGAVVIDGLRSLLQTQFEAGCWPKSNFIKIDVFRLLVAPADLGQSRPQVYKSSTISTAFCLKALLECRNRFGEVLEEGL